MVRRIVHLATLAVGLVPIVVFSAPQTGPQVPEGPKAEEVYKDIQVFKGVPASDIIPAMEFMAASMKMRCTGCHDAKDYAAPNKNKATSRKMVLMQREINEKNFEGKLEVTCNSCHNGMEHPAGVPIPTGLNMRHVRTDSAPKAEELFKKYQDAIGSNPSSLLRTGTLTAPNEETHDAETKPAELIQTADGKFRFVADTRKFGSNGTQVWYGAYPMTDEPAAIFGRMGRAYRGEQAFAGLERVSTAGRDKIGQTTVWVVRGARAATQSTEEMWFDANTGYLLRLVNIRRSSIGTVLSYFDYEDYKKSGSATVPMKITATFPGGDKWTMEFVSAKEGAPVTDSMFAVGGGG